jgi:hypothetical protein
MLNKAFVSFSVLVFFLTSVFILPAVSEDVAPQTDKSISKEAPKENTEVNKIEMPKPAALPDNSKSLDNIQTALAINCAAGNVIACIPSLGLNILKVIKWFVKDNEDTKENPLMKGAIFSALKDACLDALGTKDTVEIPIKDTKTNKEGKIVCKTTESTFRTEIENEKAVADLSIYYSENGTLQELLPKFIPRIPIFPKREKARAIAQTKCFRLLEKEDKGEEEYSDPDTGDKLKVTCWQEYIGGDKFPILRGNLTKNGKPFRRVVFMSPGIKRSTEGNPISKGKE